MIAFVATRQGLKPGDSIRIVDGPFRDLVGSVEMVDADKHRLRATIIMKEVELGRETPVELDFLQVEKL